MAFKKQEVNTLSLFLLVLSILPLTKTTNIDCNGKAFHCVNSTHFMICVDIGRGYSSTVDDFVIPCPTNTECRVTNKFECEYPPVVTLPPVYSSTDGTTRTKQIETTTPWKPNSDILLTSADPLEVEVYNPVSVGELTSPEENLIVESVIPYASEDVFKTDQSMAGNMEDQKFSSQMDTISTTTFGDSLDVVTTDMPTMITSLPDIFTTESITKSDKTTINDDFGTYSAHDTTTNQNLIEFKTDTNLFFDTSTEHILSSDMSITHNAEERNKNITLEGNDILNANLNVSSTETYATSTIPVTDDAEGTTSYTNLNTVTIDNSITTTTSSLTLKPNETIHKIKDWSSTSSTNIPLELLTLIETVDSSVRKENYAIETTTIIEKVSSLSSLPDLTTESLPLKRDDIDLNVQDISTISHSNIPLDYSTIVDNVDSSKQIFTYFSGDITTEIVTISNEGLITPTGSLPLKKDDADFNIQDISYTSLTNFPLGSSTDTYTVDSSKHFTMSSDSNFATEGVTNSEKVLSLSSLSEATTTKSLPLKADDKNFNSGEKSTTDYSTTVDIVDSTQQQLTSSSGDFNTEVVTISNKALLKITTTERLPLKADDTNFNAKDISHTMPTDLSLEYSTPINDLDISKQLFTTSIGDMTTEAVTILDKTSSLSTQPEISTTESFILKLDDTNVGIQNNFNLSPINLPPDDSTSDVITYKEIFTTSKGESTTDEISILDTTSSLPTQTMISTTKSLNFRGTSGEENLSLPGISYTSPINIQQDYSVGADVTDIPKMSSASSKMEFTTEKVIILDKAEQTNTLRDISTGINFNTAQLITTTEVDFSNANIAADMDEAYHKQALTPVEVTEITSKNDIRQTYTDIYDSTRLTEKLFLTTSLDGMYSQTTEPNIDFTQDSIKTLSEISSSSIQKFKQYQSTVDELIPTTLIYFDHSTESFQQDLKSSATAYENTRDLTNSYTPAVSKTPNREYIKNDGVNTPLDVHDLPTAEKVTKAAADYFNQIESNLSLTNVNSSKKSANLTILDTSEVELQVPIHEVSINNSHREDNLSTRSITEEPKILPQTTEAINTVLEKSSNDLLLGFTIKIKDGKLNAEGENDDATSRPYVPTTGIRNTQAVRNEQYEQILISSTVKGLGRIPIIEATTFTEVASTTTESVTFYGSDMVGNTEKNEFVTGLNVSEMTTTSDASIVPDGKIFELNNGHNYYVTTPPTNTLQEKTAQPLDEKLLAISPMLTDSPKTNLDIPIDLRSSDSRNQNYTAPNTEYEAIITSNNTDTKETIPFQDGNKRINNSTSDVKNMKSKISKSLNSTLGSHKAFPNENPTNNNFSLQFITNSQKHNGTINLMKNQYDQLNLSLNKSKEGLVGNLQIDNTNRSYDENFATESTVAISRVKPEKPVKEFNKTMVTKATFGRLGLSENVEPLTNPKNISQNYNASNSYKENKTHIAHYPLSSQTAVNPVAKNESFQQPSNVQINRVNNLTLHNKDQNVKVMFDCLYRYRGRYADNENCRKFYICVGKQNPIVGLCPVNTVFSEIRKQCTKNLSHCIRNYMFYCTSEGRFSDLFVNNIYYVCVRNNIGKFIRYKMQCEIGYHLDNATIQCMPNVVEVKSTLSDSENSQKSSDISGSKTNSDESHKNTSRNSDFKCETEGKFADPSHCRKYYICSKNSKLVFKRKLKSCDSDEVFDKQKMKCVDAESSEC